MQFKDLVPSLLD